MIFGIITLITALTIAGVAAWFSIAGLMAIFSAAAMPIAVMAGTLEVGKLLTASWLYRYWNDTSLALKAYLSIAVTVLMLITSMGIFGYLSKAHLDQAGASGDAFAIVERLDGQIAREQNKISILEERIDSLQTGGGSDVSSSIQQQEAIRDGAWQRVQGDIDYAQGQIEKIREQLDKDLAAVDSQLQANLQLGKDRLAALDAIVLGYTSQGTTTTTTRNGGIFSSDETATVDNVAKGAEVRATQKAERDDITAQQVAFQSTADSKKQQIRQLVSAEISTFQTNIDKYRSQAQTTIDQANAEINTLRNSSSQDQDDVLARIDEYNAQIDAIYDGLVSIKDQKFEAESSVRALEKEVGPIKYVAQLIFGGDSQELLDKAVQVFILLLVFVFDPLAVMLVIAANQTLLRYGIDLESAGPKGDPDGNSASEPSASGDQGSREQLEQPSNDNESNTSISGLDPRDTLSLQQQGTDGSESSELNRSSSVDTAAESSSQKKRSSSSSNRSASSKKKTQNNQKK